MKFEKIIPELKEYVRKEMGKGGAHDFDHIARVLKIAERIGEAEGADLDVVFFAALFHDIDRQREDKGEVSCHAESSAEHTRRLLRNYLLLPGDFIERVAVCIERHRFREGRTPESLEEKVLSDADKLDAMGATGIARAYLFGGAFGERVWEENPKNERFYPGMDVYEYSPRTEYVLKLSKLKEKMFTKTGRKLAERRHRFMEIFFEELENEVIGDR